MRELVYLDAFVPGPGESVAGIGRRASTPTLDLGSVLLAPPPDRDFDDPEESAWQNARRVPHALRCFSEPVRLSAPVEEHVLGLTYIKATKPSTSPKATVATEPKTATDNNPSPTNNLEPTAVRVIGPAS